MRFNCGPNRYTRQVLKEQKMQAWHRYFCWLPVRLAENDCRWLETVERKFGGWDTYNNCGFSEEYREIEK